MCAPTRTPAWCATAAAATTLKWLWAPRSASALVASRWPSITTPSGSTRQRGSPFTAIDGTPAGGLVSPSSALQTARSAAPKMRFLQAA